MPYPQPDPAPQTQPRPTPALVPGRGGSRLLPILGVGFGLLGLMAGVAAWFRAAPSDPSTTPIYSEQQVAEAQAAVCEAYRKGVRSMRVVAGRVVDNPADTLPVAVNSRLAEVAVGNYFINALDEHPAAPAVISSTLRGLALAYQDVALIQLADGTPADYKYEKEVVNDAVGKLDQLCP